MDMDWNWMTDNWQAVLSFITVAGVVVVWLRLRYWGKSVELQRDLLELLQNALEYLKARVGDEMGSVTEADVDRVADWFYAKFVDGKALDGLVTKEKFRLLLWGLFSRWRDIFMETQSAEVRGLLLWQTE